MPTPVEPKNINAELPSAAAITGVVLFKKIYYEQSPYTIFGYFNISTNILKINEKKPSLNDLSMFNPINQFINTRNYDTPNADKGIYYYHKDNLTEFIRKCYIPPLQATA